MSIVSFNRSINRARCKVIRKITFSGRQQLSRRFRAALSFRNWRNVNKEQSLLQHLFVASVLCLWANLHTQPPNMTQVHISEHFIQLPSVNTECVYSPQSHTLLVGSPLHLLTVSIFPLPTAAFKYTHTAEIGNIHGRSSTRGIYRWPVGQPGRGL